jgi:hypothetical protein
MSSNTKFTAVLVAVALALTVGACGSGAPYAPPSAQPTTSRSYPPPSTASPAAAGASHQTDARSCPAQWSPLTVTTDVADEVAYITDVAVCVSPDGGRTYLDNQGDGVWVPMTTRSWPVQTTRSFRSQLARVRTAAYATTMRNVYSYDLLTPGEVLVVPVAPAELAWQLDIRYTMMWHLHDAVLNEVQNASQQGLVDALDRRTRRGAAVSECTLNLYKILERQPDLTDDSRSTRMLAAVSDTADGASCVQKWREADEAAARGGPAGEKAVVTAERLPAALRGQQAEVLSTVDSYLGRFSSAAKVVRLVLPG